MFTLPSRRLQQRGVALVGNRPLRARLDRGSGGLSCTQNQSGAWVAKRSTPTRTTTAAHRWSTLNWRVWKSIPASVAPPDQPERPPDTDGGEAQYPVPAVGELRMAHRNARSPLPKCR